MHSYTTMSFCRVFSRLAAPKAAVPPVKQPRAATAWATTSGVLESGTMYTNRGPAAYSANAMRYRAVGVFLQLTAAGKVMLR